MISSSQIKILNHFLLILSLSLPLLGYSQSSSTATAEVAILENYIYVPYSSTFRTIRIYTPPNYHSDTTRYPVIYMLDGQNLYDEKTSYAGEWKVDESLNALSAQGKCEVIVVGIDNHGVFRMQEYNIYNHERFGPQYGELFLEFIAKELKPLIDQTYRTISDREHTAIGGSSMGGLMAYAGVMTHPEVFGKGLVFSPSFWVSDDIFALHKKNPLLDMTKVYMIVGSEEGMMVPLFEKMDKVLLETMPSGKYHGSKISEGTHSEKTWAEAFPEAITWLLKD